MIATVGPGELLVLMALVMWPALSWWAVGDVLARRGALRGAGQPPVLWLVAVVALPLAGAYLYVRMARPRVKVES